MALFNRIVVGTDGSESAAEAVRQAVESQGGAPISGVIVISDGRFNHGEPAEVVTKGMPSSTSMSAIDGSCT